MKAARTDIPHDTPGSNKGENDQRVALDIRQQRRDFMELARRQESHLLRTARRLCGRVRGGEDRISDLVQDTLVCAYEAILEGKFELRSVPGREHQERAWLLRILTNRFINDYRRRQRWETGVDLDTIIADRGEARIGLQAAPSETPDTHLLSETLDEPLENALASLPEGHRLCIILCEIEGIDYAEAAEILNVPLGTVRSRLSRARLQLQKLLEQEARRRRWSL